MTENDLLKLKSEIDKNKIEIAQIQGEVTGLLNQLKRDYKVDSLQEAIKLQTTISNEIEELKEALERELSLIEEMYATEN